MSNKKYDRQKWADEFEESLIETFHGPSDPQPEPPDPIRLGFRVGCWVSIILFILLVIFFLAATQN